MSLHSEVELMPTQKGLSHQFALLRWSMREIIQGQLWPVVMALTLIIACVFGLSALGDRMDDVIEAQSRNSLTADLIFRSANPPTDMLLENTKDLPSSQMVNFSSMAFSDKQMKLIQVRAVDDKYPLQGDLVLKGNSGSQSHVAPNQLWIEPRLMTDLNVKIGDTVSVGDADFVVSGVIESEPGLSFNPFNQVPRAYIHANDLEKTGALMQGSRVRYSLYLNADDDTAQALKDKIELSPSDRWVERDGQSRSARIFERTEQYLSLTVAIVILMAAFTLVLTCQHYVQSRKSTVAMLKSLGASKTWLRNWQFTQVGLLFGISVVLGSAIGMLIEYGLRFPLKDLLPDPLPSYGLMPFFAGVITCIAIAIPALGVPLFNLLNTPASRVVGQESAAQYKQYAWLLVFPLGLMLLSFGLNIFVWLIFAGLIFAIALLGLVSLMILKLVKKVSQGAALKLALSRILRTPFASGLQFGVLGLSLMLLATIWLVRSDLLVDWQQTIPEDAPNVFAMNIAPNELDGYLAELDKQNLSRSEAYPIIRGRLTQINGEDAKAHADNPEEVGALRREINFTFTDTLPEHNKQLDGSWGTPKSVSVESEIASELNIELGDKISFVINSQTLQATVTSIREVEWRDLKPNFFFIFSPDVLENLPSTYLMSFRVDDEAQYLGDLSRTYPTVSVIDLRSMTAKVQQLLVQVVSAISLLASLAALAGVLLIFTLLRLSLAERQQEIQLYRTLGASKKSVTKTLWFEYGVMALIAGLVACLGAEACVAALMHFGFELDPRLHLGLWITLPSLALLMLALVVRILQPKLLAPLSQGRIGV